MENKSKPPLNRFNDWMVESGTFGWLIFGVAVLGSLKGCENKPQEPLVGALVGGLLGAAFAFAHGWLWLMLCGLILSLFGLYDISDVRGGGDVPGRPDNWRDYGGG